LSENTAARPTTVAAVSIVIAVSILAGLLLFFAVPMVPRISARSYSTGFADGYNLIAGSIANGTGYRWSADTGETMVREPGYPLLLAAIFRLFGEQLEPAQCVNWLLALGIALALFRLAHHIAEDSRVALLASLLFLLYPGTLIAESRGGVEILFIFTASLFMLSFYHAVKRGTLPRFFLAGLLLGATLQVRSTPAAFPVLWLLYGCMAARSFRQRFIELRKTVCLVAGMAVVVTPWVIRNYLLVHKFVPTSALAGVALQEGQYTCQALSWNGDFYAAGQAAGRERGRLAEQLGIHFEGREYFQVFFDPNDEWRFNNLLFREGRDKYLARPGLLATCVARNTVNFWFLGKTFRITELNVLLQLPLLILAFSGLVFLRKQGQLGAMLPILIFAGSIFLAHLPLVAEARYSVPVCAFLIIPASVAIFEIGRKLRAQSLQEGIS
jgi:4-amino-4-deoxy-L-arabinose transferase-like glycosyltransferase